MTSLLTRVARNASFNVAQQAWLAALSLIATPVLYRALGAGPYGLFAIVNVVLAQFAVLELGFGHSATRFIASAATRNDADALRRILRTAAAVFLLAGVVGAAAIAALAGRLIDSYFLVPAELQAQGRRALLLSASLFLLSLQSNLYGAVWRGLQRFDTLNLMRGAAGTLQTAGAVLVVLSGGTLDGVIVWTVAVGVLTVAAHVVLLVKHGRNLMPWPQFDKGTFLAMKSLSIPLLVAGILSQVHMAGGVLVLGRLVSVDLLPLYSIPFGLLQKLLMMQSGLAGALFPAVVEATDSGDRERLARIQAQGARLLTVAALPVVVVGMLLAHPFLSVWLGAGFAESGSRVLQCFLVAFGIATVTVPGTELARGGGRPGRLVIYTAILATVHVGAALLLTPRLGVVGAAAGLPLAQLAGALYLVSASGHMPAILHGLRVPLLLGAAYGASAALAGVATGGLAGRALAAAVLTAAYAAAAWRFSLQEDQRTAMLRLLPRFR